MRRNGRRRGAATAETVRAARDVERTRDFFGWKSEGLPAVSAVRAVTSPFPLALSLPLLLSLEALVGVKEWNKDGRELGAAEELARRKERKDAARMCPLTVCLTVRVEVAVVVAVLPALSRPVEARSPELWVLDARWVATALWADTDHERRCGSAAAAPRGGSP